MKYHINIISPKSFLNYLGSSLTVHTVLYLSASLFIKLNCSGSSSHLICLNVKHLLNEMVRLSEVNISHKQMRYYPNLILSFYSQFYNQSFCKMLQLHNNRHLITLICTLGDMCSEMRTVAVIRNVKRENFA